MLWSPVFIILLQIAPLFAKTIYDFSVENVNGETESMEKYRGKVVIFVNVASYCGYTDWNYNDLKELQEKYFDRGLRVAAFPCNQFGQQEPDKIDQISKFVQKTYNYQPDLYSKIDVNGPKTPALWTFLKSPTSDDQNTDTTIPWNFSKFLVDRDGSVVGRFSHRVNPKEFEDQIRTLLDQKSEL